LLKSFKTLKDPALPGLILSEAILLSQRQSPLGLPKTLPTKTLPKTVRRG
jgi:hypothetical protein